MRRLYPNLKSIAGHRVSAFNDLHENGTEFKYFTLVRDPVKLCASRFQFKVQISGKENLVFEEWIQQDWMRNHQTKMLAGVTDVNEAIRVIQEKNIFVGMTERFDESMVMLKRLVANELNIAYRPVNVAPKNSIKERLLSNKRTRQMLVEAQQADIELYNYVKHELYPTFQREYGPSLEADVAEYQRTRGNNFNNLNLTLCRMKHYMLYKPMLYLSRNGVRIV
ncbi:MAG: sulfotransferase family 2 domain-containing protein [Anaerolineales bacterium]